MKYPFLAFLVAASLWPSTALSGQASQLFGIFSQSDPESYKGELFMFWEVGSGRVAGGRYLPDPLLTGADLKSVRIATREIATAPIEGLEFRLSDHARQKIEKHFKEAKTPLVVMIDGFIYTDVDRERGKIISDGSILFVAFPQAQPASRHLITLISEKFQKVGLWKK